jgi:predicted transcriptional regulator of viral defense system
MCTICAVEQTHLPSVALLRDRFDGRPFRVAEAVEAGISRSTLYRLLHDGNLVAAGRGVMQLPDGGMGALSGLAAVSARVPGGTICLNSALSFWDLTDEIPERIHLAVPRGTRPPKIDQPSTVVHVFDADTFDIDRRQERTDADEPFWVYSAERSIVDAMRMSRWVGRDVALQALRRYLTRPGSDPARVAELARELGVIGQIQPALAALLS